jgi:hypothetical protein
VGHSRQPRWLQLWQIQYHQPSWSLLVGIVIVSAGCGEHRPREKHNGADKHSDDKRCKCHRFISPLRPFSTITCTIDRDRPICPAMAL